MAAPTIRTVASFNNHQEHSIDFFGNELIVTVTSSPSVISRWIRNVRYYEYDRRSYSSLPLVVGVGVQWAPAGFHSNPPQNSYYSDQQSGSYYDDPPPDCYYGVPLPGYYYADHPPCSYVDPPPDTLQLCVGKRCLIIQLSHCSRIPEDLRSFLADPQTTFVGVWNSQDARKLAQSRHRLVIAEILDIRNYVTDSEGRSLSACSFETIVEECMGYQGVRLDPEISMSDWSVYNLCDEQILMFALSLVFGLVYGKLEKIYQMIVIKT